MRFNAAAFDTFLGGIGQSVTWRRSFACTCVSPTSGSPDPKHQLCGGKGRIWEPPVGSVVGVASQKVLTQWMASGQWENGDTILSVPQSSPLWDAAGQYDRVTMLNATDVFSQPMTRGAITERLLFVPASIERVFWLHPQTGVIVEGGKPAVSPDGLLTWTSGEPPTGVNYSLTGRKYHEYFVFGELPGSRNQHGGMRLPKKMVARKWDLFGR